MFLVSNLNDLDTLNIDDPKKLFRNGIRIKEITNNLKVIQKLKLAKLDSVRYIKCVNRCDLDFLSLTESQKLCTGTGTISGDLDNTECSSCNRTLLVKEKEIFEEYRLSINYPEIYELICQKLDSEFTIMRIDEAHILLHDKEKVEHQICLLDICEKLECKTSFYYSDRTLYVVCDQSEFFEAPTVIWLFNLLKMENYEISNYIRTKVPNIEMKKINDVMNKTIDDSKWQDFEGFINDLIKYVNTNPKLVNKGLSFLEKYSGTSVSSFLVKLSGPGKSDAFVINLSEYIKEVFHSNKFLEYKHSGKEEFSKQTIRNSDVQQLIEKSMELDGILFSNRIKVVSYVWNRIIQSFQQKGYWQYVVINRYLLIFIISLFVEEFWDDPEIIRKHINKEF